MDTSTIIWIVVAVVVIGAIIAFLVSRSGTRREEASRAKAAEMREKAQEHDCRLRESEASAADRFIAAILRGSCRCGFLGERSA